ncbi:MAG: hypothetical protein K9N53_02620 [Candidatus Marinimicrobia bacterium]|nr:hypothetical protein [Candidatus Neomarinimicrobiota bacterium]MCF7827843.1 hypothetical protein [Candidatus Neomarinimicrobiota bacterium]
MEKLLRFRPDIVYETMTIREQPTHTMSLAASGSSRFSTTLERVGVLSGKKEQTLARVFKNSRENQYHLYFVDEEERDLNGAIITSPKTFKFFVLEDDEAIIPSEAGIDPLQDKLVLTFPDYSMRISPEALSGSLVEGDGISLNFHPTTKEEEGTTEGITYSCVLSVTDGEKIPSKILFRSKDYIRLIPVENNHAQVSFPEKITATIDCFCYE